MGSHTQFTSSLGVSNGKGYPTSPVGRRSVHAGKVAYKRELVPRGMILRSSGFLCPLWRLWLLPPTSLPSIYTSTLSYSTNNPHSFYYVGKEFDHSFLSCSFQTFCKNFPKVSGLWQENPNISPDQRKNMQQPSNNIPHSHLPIVVNSSCKGW